MTREEAIHILDNLKPSNQVYTANDAYAVGQALCMAIKALEQEPTTKNNLGVDAVSRQAVLDLIADYDLSMGQVVKGIHALPSVTPQLRKGHWIDREVYDADRWKCSECGRTEQWKENFCPNCGADMRADRSENE